MMKARKPPEKLWTSITVPSHTHLFRCTVQVSRYPGVQMYRSPTHLLQVSR